MPNPIHIKGLRKKREPIARTLLPSSPSVNSSGKRNRGKLRCSRAPHCARTITATQLISTKSASSKALHAASGTIQASQGIGAPTVTPLNQPSKTSLLTLPSRRSAGVIHQGIPPNFSIQPFSGVPK